MQSSLPLIWLFRLYQALFLLLPWSVEVNFGAWALMVPAEPLIALAGIGLAVVLVREGRYPPLHKLVWLSLAWVVWLGIAAGFSCMPVVSWKYWLVEAGHWWVFFVGLLCWPAMWPLLIRLFSWSMLGLVLYTIVHHGFYDFRTDQALLAPMPFFADHTVYGAVLVLVLLNPAPASIALNLRYLRAIYFSNCLFQISNFKLKGCAQPPNLKFEKKNLKFEKLFTIPDWLKLMAMGGGLAVFLFALYLSNSRAAWLSLLLASLFGLVLYHRKQWRWWVFLGGIALFGGVFFQEKMATRLAADVSTQERLNRYACAWRMVADQPWTGFGPGTFQFQYLPYQKQSEMTRISVAEPIANRGPENYGRGGGAHSEYLQALAELGWPGLLIWLLLVFGSLGMGIRKFWQTKAFKWLLLSLALLSFFLHALVNNFLHDARVAALVWGALAMILHFEFNQSRVASIHAKSWTVPVRHRR